MQVTTKDHLFVKMISEKLKDLACADNSVDTLSMQLRLLVNAFSASKELESCFSNPLVTDLEKKSIISALLAKEEIPLIHVLLKALAELNKIYLFPLVIDALESKIAEHQGQHVVCVTTVFPLSGDQSAAIVTAMKKHFGGQVKIKNDVDPKIIGGFILRLGSIVMDASLLKDFYVLENQMKGLEHGADNS